MQTKCQHSELLRLGDWLVLGTGRASWHPLCVAAGFRCHAAWPLQPWRGRVCVVLNEGSSLA